MLLENDANEMKTFCETLHPATVAEALSEDYPVEEAWRVLEHTTIRNQAEIFEYFPLDWQVKMVAGTGRQHMAKLIEQMSHDDRVDLLRRLQPPVAEALLRLVDEADRRDIATLNRYEENTAGALMTTDYAWLPANITVGDALDRLRLQAPDRETIYYVYILDDRRHPLGVLSLRNLILAPRTVQLREIMEKDLVTVKVTDDREHVAQEIARYDLLAIPVIDGEGRLVGIVTYDDVIDVVVQEATEDVHRMGAVGPLERNYLQAGFLTIWWSRVKWLAILFGAELITFTALSYFSDAIAEVVVLALFVPLCISTGGNSGSQAATLITRAMALGQVSLRDSMRVFRHELVMGIALGLTLGVIGFIRGAGTPEDVRGNETPVRGRFEARVPRDTPQPLLDKGRVNLPKDSVISSHPERNSQVILPDEARAETKTDDEKFVTYEFPAGCKIRTEAVNRWQLGWVIAQAVALICLWGTLVGSMLPLIFKWFRIDPGIASSPFVSTFVDVTGIIIYFSIAKMYLL
jgi:magnesium transporter